MEERIIAEVGGGEAKEGVGRLEAMFLQVDKRAGELDEALVEGVIGTVTLGEPEFFEDVVGFVKESAVETIEIAEVVRVEIVTREGFNQCGDF